MRFIIIILVIVSFSEGQKRNRIVGGRGVYITGYPYQVSVQRFEKHSCGGSIISLDWILTAAHCIRNYTSEVFSVRVGSSYHNSGGAVHSVLNIIIHEKYSDIYLYDIALLKLNSTITANDIEIMPLPSPGVDPPTGATLILTGWGALFQGGDIPVVLQMVDLKVISREDCQGTYGKNRITEVTFCATDLEGDRDVCPGDSGGPAVIDGVQYGIVSWGSGCDKTYNPGVYTNVPMLVDWIQSKCALVII